MQTSAPVNPRGIPCRARKTTRPPDPSGIQRRQQQRPALRAPGGQQPGANRETQRPEQGWAPPQHGSDAHMQEPTRETPRSARPQGTRDWWVAETRAQRGHLARCHLSSRGQLPPRRCLQAARDPRLMRRWIGTQDLSGSPEMGFSALNRYLHPD